MQSPQQPTHMNQSFEHRFGEIEADDELYETVQYNISLLLRKCYYYPTGSIDMIDALTVLCRYLILSNARHAVVTSQHKLYESIHSCIMRLQTRVNTPHVLTQPKLPAHIDLLNNTVRAYEELYNYTLPIQV